MNIWLDSLFVLFPFVVYLFAVFSLLEYWFITDYDEDKGHKTFKVKLNPSLTYRDQTTQANGLATSSGLVFDNYFAVFIIIVIDFFGNFLSVVFFLITFFTTKERVTAPPKEKSSFKDDFRDLMGNRPWLVLFFFGILYVAYTTLKYGTLMYYFTYYVGDVSLATGYMIAGLLAAMAGAASTKTLTRWWGKRGVVNLFMGSGAIASALFFLCGPDAVMLIFVLGIVAEYLAAPIAAVYFAMLADSADYSEWKNGRRATGLIFSAGTVAMKFGSGIAGAATGWILMGFGYVAGVDQTPEALLGIRLLMSLIPAGAALLMLVLFQLYRIDEATLAIIESELAAQRGTAEA